MSKPIQPPRPQKPSLKIFSCEDINKTCLSLKAVETILFSQTDKTKSYNIDVIFCESRAKAKLRYESEEGRDKAYDRLKTFLGGV